MTRAYLMMLLDVGPAAPTIQRIQTASTNALAINGLNQRWVTLTSVQGHDYEEAWQRLAKEVRRNPYYHWTARFMQPRQRRELFGPGVTGGEGL